MREEREIIREWMRYDNLTFCLFIYMLGGLARSMTE